MVFSDDEGEAMTHAGFWVDGAVRKPEQRHCDMDDTVITKWKREDDAPTEFDICRRSFSGWDKVYWLDTTPRESLTPEELFSVVRVISPATKTLYRDKSDDSFYDLSAPVPIKVDWGNLTQYPPPSESQWVRITRENVGQYLFRDCRTQKNDITYAGRVVGWCIEDDCCLVESDYKTEEPILQWDHVEVQNASTS